MEKCQFDDDGCSTHAKPGPPIGQPRGSPPVLCTHAAQALQRRVEEIEHLRVGEELIFTKRLASLEAANARLRRHVRHDPECKIDYTKAVQVCTCGLSAALSPGAGRGEK